jgi:thiol-disulfide isomerase/thioredoxin
VSAADPPGPFRPLSARAAFLRLLVSTVIIGAVLAALWLAGIISSSEEQSLVVSSGGTRKTIQVQPANVGVETPNPGGLTVGLNIGNLAPDFEVSDIEGGRLRLSDFRGRAVLLNFWATWCGPCKAELPDIETVLRRYRGQGLAVIALNNGESLATARRYVSKLGLDLTAFALDPDEDVVRLYGIRGMPTSVFIDPDGVITRVYAGQLSRGLMESAVQLTLAPAGGTKAP